MSFPERPAVQAGSEDPAEVGALQDVLVETPLAVFDRLAGGLRPGDLPVELGQLAPVQLSPLVARGAACGRERRLFGEREPGFAQEQNEANLATADSR